MTTVEKAFLIALQAHEGQARKSSGAPYIMHPVAVALMLSREGFRDEVIASALVHDVIEDTSVTEETLRRELGNEVTDLVLSVTEDKTLPWIERKKHYIERVRNSSDEAKAISLADKIHNVEGYIDAFALAGPAMWEQFSGKREDHVWFAEAMLKMFEESYDHPLVERFKTKVASLQGLQSPSQE